MLAKILKRGDLKLIVDIDAIWSDNYMAKRDFD